MFKTEHLEGRSVYETDEVVCMNIYVKSNLVNYFRDVYLSQILVSLDTYNFDYSPFSFSIDGETISEKDVSRELREGVNAYHRTRIKLGLKK